MTHRTSTHLFAVLATAAFVFTRVFAQTPAPGAPQAPPGPGAGAFQGPGGRGGRGGLPGATPEQNQAVADMNTSLAALTATATAARNELATVAIADVRNVAAIRAAADRLRTAELALASARADAFARLQAGPNKLSPDQVTALINMTSNAGGRGGGRGGF